MDNRKQEYTYVPQTNGYIEHIDGLGWLGWSPTFDILISVRGTRLS